MPTLVMKSFVTNLVTYFAAILADKAIWLLRIFFASLLNQPQRQPRGQRQAITLGSFEFSRLNFVRLFFNIVNRFNHGE